MARARKAPSTKSAAAVQSGAAQPGQLTCPECGRTFGRAAALGAHRRHAHGVVGASSSRPSDSRRRRTGSAASRQQRPGTTAQRNGQRDGATTIDRDALLATVFPQGIPPRENIIRAANSWLDEAERLTRLR